MPTNYITPQDYNGRLFFEGATCYVTDWMNPFLITGSDLEKCFSWRVVLSDDRSHYRLVSRPNNFNIALDDLAASYLTIYNEAPVVAPERYLEQWNRLQLLGWSVWSERIEDCILLSACNKARADWAPRIIEDVSKQYTIGEAFGKNMWNFLVDSIEQGFQK